MPLTTQQDESAVNDDLVAQARAEAELRLTLIDIEEARAAGKTESVASTVATAGVH